VHGEPAEDDATKAEIMWSRFNVVGLRRRWAAREDDPGRLQRSFGTNGDGRNGNGRRDIAEVAKRAFVTRDIAIDCIYPGCKGKFLTSLREFSHNGSAGSRIVLRCTRRHEHELAFTIRPYTPAEHERLRALHQEGEPLHCARCHTVLQTGSRNGRWLAASAEMEHYFCPWCGLTWEVRNPAACPV
jgi:hypothetical protein